MAASSREIFFTKVTLRLEVARVQPDQGVFVVGDGEAFGAWDASKARRLSRKPIANRAGSAVSVWESSLELMTGVPVNYKYVIIGRDRRVKWESNKSEFRTVVPSGIETVVMDGAFGRDTDEVWVDEGWLNSDVQVRLELGYYDIFDGVFTPPITGTLVESSEPLQTLANSSSSTESGPRSSTPLSAHPPMSLHFFDGNSLLSREVITLPMKDKWNEVVFHMSDLNKLKITVEVYDRRTIDPSTRYSGESQSQNEHDRLARTCISRSMLKEMRGICSVPLFNSQLENVGTLNFKYLVVTPFKHALNNLASIWKSFTRASKPSGKSVGHRGCGSTRTTFISENTILSFLTAADYGADYVEFDVQITNEGIPVINHDFHISVTSSDGAPLHIPVSSLTKKQFKSIRPSSAISSVFQRIPGIKRSKSMTMLPRSSRRRTHGAQTSQMSSSDDATSSDETKPKQNSSEIDESASSSDAPLTQSSSLESLDLEHLHAFNRATPDSTATGSQQVGFDVFSSLAAGSGGASSNGNGSVPKSIINPHDQFATLDETLRLVPSEVGFVIEVKYPAERFQHSSKMRYAERNLYADAVLKSVFNAMHNPHLAQRKIMLISFDPDLCVLLSQKQPRFPVLLLLCLSHGVPVGDGDDEIEGFEPKCHSLDVAAKFAKNVRLQGIICDAASVLTAPQHFVTTAHDASLLLMTYGAENMDEEKRAIQKAVGVDSLIMDNVVHINRESRQRKQVSSLFLADYGRQHFKIAPNVPASSSSS